MGDCFVQGGWICSLFDFVQRVSTNMIALTTALTAVEDGQFSGMKLSKVIYRWQSL